MTFSILIMLFKRDCKSIEERCLIIFFFFRILNRSEKEKIFKNRSKLRGENERKEYFG